MENSTTKLDDEVSEKEEESSFLRGLQWLTRKLNLLEEGATSPNWKAILLVFISLFGSSCSMTFLFPFIPEMMMHFGYSEYDKGTYGGMVASAMFSGITFGSIFWGWLADRRGRKPVLILCLTLTGVIAGLFGFSDNIITAIGLRFLCGLTNGIFGTGKAVMYDVSDNTNQALGMTILSLAWGTGLVAGPLAGGILATPCTKWPDLCDADSLFGRYPFLLPSLFPFVISIIISVIVIWKFEETYDPSAKMKLNMEFETQECVKDETRRSDLSNSNKPYDDHNSLVRRISLNGGGKNHHHAAHNILSTSLISLYPEAEMSVSLGKEVLQRQKMEEKQRELNLTFATSVPDLSMYKSQGFDIFSGNSQYSKSTSHIPKNMNSLQEVVSSQPKDKFHTEKSHCSAERVTERGYSNESLLPKIMQEEDNVCECCDRCFSLCFTNSSLHKLLRLPDIWASIILYTVFSFAVFGLDDIFPMFASTSPDLGGLGFNTNEIGMALGCVSLPLLFLQIKLYPFLVGKLSLRRTAMLMMFVCMVTSQCIPMLRSLVNSPVLLWVCLVLIQVPYKIALNCCFASISLYINNSAPQELAGQANGVALTSTSTGRSFAPVVAGLLFSWSVTHGQFIGAPFDMGLPFFTLGILYGVSFIQCTFMNPRLDTQKK